MKKVVLLKLLLVFAMAGQLWAQTRTVTGRVTGPEGSPLPGVTVVEKGTTNGVTTTSEGNFSLTVQPNATLVVSFIGMANQEVILGNRSMINVQLKEDSQKLSEVVVTAFGIEAEKRTLGYSAQNVNPAQLQQSREPNIVNALAGKVAGVQINNSGGQAGSSSRIVIRGNTSLTGENQPLFVVDGIPIDNSTNRGINATTEGALFNGYGGNRAIDLDPNLVENVTVLKGASATALYGSRGANGVIVITTKKGQRDASRSFPKVTFNSSLAFDDAILAGYQDQYHLGLNGLYRNGLPNGEGGYAQRAPGATTSPNPQTTVSWGPHRDSVAQEVIDSIGVPGVFNPRDQFYRTGKVWNHSISLSGGTEKSTYLLAYSVLDQEGIVPNNTFKRHSVAANFTSQLTEKFNVATSINYIRSNNDRLSEGNGARSYLFGLNFTPISFDINRYFTMPGNPNVMYTPTAFNNPFWLANNNGVFSEVDRFIVSTEVGYQILPWLRLSNRVGMDTYTDQMREEVNVGTRGAVNGRMFEALLKRSQINNDLILSANYNLSEEVRLTGLVGHNVNTRTYNRRTIRGLDLSIPNYFDITNAKSTQAFQDDEERRLVGLYGSATLDFRNYLFLTATGRNDWSSTLPIEHNSYFYPSVSLGFVFTEVLGLANSSYFPYGKVRVSWARAGNDAPAYYTNQTFSQAGPSDGTRGTINFPFNGQNAFIASNQLNNNQLVHELVTEKEIGFDFRFLQNRLGIDLALYDKVSNNQILDQEISAASGYVTRVVNAGEISNKGIELVLTASPLRIGSFSWEILGNFARNRYKLNSIAEGVDNIFLGGFTSPQIRADKDFGYGVIWGSKFMRNDQGQLVIDEDGLPIVDDALGAIGNVMPDWTAGLRNTLAWKGLSLSALIDVRQGGDILNMDQYYTTFYGTAKVTEARNTMFAYNGVLEDGTVNTKRIKRDELYWRNFYSSVDENFVEDGSFVKLREITLAYSLPQSLMARTPLQSVTFSATGRNVWIRSDFSYGDPEGSLLGNTNAQGFYHAVTPATKGITFGVNVVF